MTPDMVLGFLVGMFVGAFIEAVVFLLISREEKP